MQMHALPGEHSEQVETVAAAVFDHVPVGNQTQEEIIIATKNKATGNDINRSWCGWAGCGKACRWRRQRNG